MSSDEELAVHHGRRRGRRCFTAEGDDDGMSDGDGAPSAFKAQRVTSPPPVLSVSLPPLGGVSPPPAHFDSRRRSDSDEHSYLLYENDLEEAGAEEGGGWGGADGGQDASSLARAASNERRVLPVGVTAEEAAEDEAAHRAFQQQERQPFSSNVLSSAAAPTWPSRGARDGVLGGDFNGGDDAGEGGAMRGGYGRMRMQPAAGKRSSASPVSNRGGRFIGNKVDSEEEASDSEADDGTTPEEALTFEREGELQKFAGFAGGAIVLSGNGYALKCLELGIDARALFRRLVARNITVAHTQVELAGLMAGLSRSALKVRTSGGGNRLQTQLGNADYYDIIGKFSSLISPVVSKNGEPIALALLYTNLSDLGVRAAACTGGFDEHAVRRGASILAANGGGLGMAKCCAHADWATPKVERELLGVASAAAVGGGGDVDQPLNSMGKVFCCGLADSLTGRLSYGQGLLFGMSAAAVNGSSAQQLVDEPVVSVSTAGPTPYFASSALLGSAPMMVPELGVNGTGRANFAVAVLHGVKAPTPFVNEFLQGDPGGGSSKFIRFGIQAFARAQEDGVLRDPAAALSDLARAGVTVELVQPGLDAAGTTFHGADLLRLAAPKASERPPPPLLGSPALVAGVTPLNPLFSGFVSAVCRISRRLGMPSQFGVSYPSQRNPVRMSNGTLLIVGGDAEPQLACALPLTDAFGKGALGGAAEPGATLLLTLAGLLHVDPRRIANLAYGYVGRGAYSSPAFMAAFARLGGGETYAPAPLSDECITFFNAASDSFAMYCDNAALKPLLPPGHAASFAQPPSELAAGAGLLAAPLIVGGDAETQLACAVPVTAAFTVGALGGAGWRGASLREILARVLYVDVMRVSRLADGTVGGEAPSSPAFQLAYQGEGQAGRARYEAAPPTAECISCFTAARQSFDTYCAAATVQFKIPPGHSALLSLPPSELAVHAEVPAAPLIVGADAEAQLKCLLSVMPAFFGGALGGAAQPGATLRQTLADLLHVDSRRISNLAEGHAGNGAPSSPAFQLAFKGQGQARYATALPSQERSTLYNAARQSYFTYCGDVTVKPLLSDDYAAVFAQPPAEPAAGAVVPAAPLIVGGDAETQMKCLLPIIPAFKVGALGGAAQPGATLKSTMADLLHVDSTRVANLASGVAGSGAPSYPAFKNVYKAVGGRERFAPAPSSLEGIQLYDAARQSFHTYCSDPSVKSKLPPDHVSRFAQPPAAPAAGAGMPAAPLIDGGDPEPQLACILAFINAFAVGAVAGEILMPATATMASMLARLLHVNSKRVKSLSTGVAGGGAPSSAAFQKAYSRIGGAAHHMPAGPSAARAAASAAAIQAFTTYCAAGGVQHKLPVGHLALLAAPAVGVGAPAS